MQRNRARDTLLMFRTLGQSFGGDKKSVKSFVEDVSQWLPAEERNGGKKSPSEFLAAVQKGFKLKK